MTDAQVQHPVFNANRQTGRHRAEDPTPSSRSVFPTIRRWTVSRSLTKAQTDATAFSGTRYGTPPPSPFARIRSKAAVCSLTRAGGDGASPDPTVHVRAATGRDLKDAGRFDCLPPPFSGDRMFSGGGRHGQPLPGASGLLARRLASAALQPLRGRALFLSGWLWSSCARPPEAKGSPDMTPGSVRQDMAELDQQRPPVQPHPQAPAVPRGGRNPVRAPWRTSADLPPPWCPHDPRPGARQTKSGCGQPQTRAHVRALPCPATRSTQKPGPVYSDPPASRSTTSPDITIPPDRYRGEKVSATNDQPATRSPADHVRLHSQESQNH